MLIANIDDENGLILNKVNHYLSQFDTHKMSVHSFLEPNIYVLLRFVIKKNSK